MTNKFCSVVDKIRPYIGCIIGFVRFAMGIYNFILVMNFGTFVPTLPPIFLLNFAFCFLCTCGLFVPGGCGTVRVNNGTRRGRAIPKEQQNACCLRCYFYYVIIIGYTLWAVNIHLVLEMFDEKME